MKLRNKTDNSGVEDRRGRGGGSGGLGGLGGMLGGSGGGVSMGKAGGGGLILLVLVFFVGRCALGGSGGFDLGGALNGLDGGTSSNSAVPTAPTNERDSAELDFVKQVRSSVQDYWQAEFDAAGQDYEPAGLVLFDAPTRTGCGVGSPETGPFYCPADNKVYFDLGFYREMERQFGITGDTALAYVIAHEMGHHVQNELGINAEVQSKPRSQQVGPKGYSVRMELQADCLAGVWASTIAAQGGLEEGDFDEAINAAQAVGDDRIQETTSGRISPESFTHGTSEQRTKWFNKGFTAGNSEACDTFSTDDLG